MWQKLNILHIYNIIFSQFDMGIYECMNTFSCVLMVRMHDYFCHLQDENPWSRPHLINNDPDTNRKSPTSFLTLRSSLWRVSDSANKHRFSSNIILTGSITVFPLMKMKVSPPMSAAAAADAEWMCAGWQCVLVSQSCARRVWRLTSASRNNNRYRSDDHKTNISCLDPISAGMLQFRATLISSTLGWCLWGVSVHMSANQRAEKRRGPAPFHGEAR